ncbi:hypothetical protein [Nonomuraea guangzhouensis]|uniref:Protein kinase domain-containing protein n=1 Tax=Nonomuraea guangzhouensis TaxID=1291555 RepID=A0ABW4GS27_9ACTN|nr:hypothetical protein [Nonomuraea guangzhouensis]
MLLGPGGPRVIDFGVARMLDMSLTKTGEVASRRQQASGHIAQWDVSRPTPQRSACLGEVGGLGFSPGGGLPATYTTAGLLQLWDVAARRRLCGAFNLHDTDVGNVGFGAYDGAL